MEIRGWQEYLSNKLSFPFLVKRIDDTDKVLWEGLKDDKPFGLGITMKVLGVESEDDFYGIIVKVKEGRLTAFVPILDLEIQDDSSMNKKYLDEYAEYFLN
jgi:hypothetical protein